MCIIMTVPKVWFTRDSLINILYFYKIFGEYLLYFDIKRLSTRYASIHMILLVEKTGPSISEKLRGCHSLVNMRIVSFLSVYVCMIMV